MRGFSNRKVRSKTSVAISLVDRTDENVDRILEVLKGLSSREMVNAIGYSSALLQSGKLGGDYEKLLAAQQDIIKWLTKLVETRDNKNPQIVVESLRPANDGELINDKPAKGWVVEIECATCGVRRTVNTQDAFQVRFCEEHKAEARKVANKAKRENAKISELLNQSEEELRERLAELKAQAA